MKKQFLLLFTVCIAAYASYAQAPNIISFSPSSGPVGTLVHITGIHLSSPTAFTIGGVSAIVVSDADTTLVGMVMPNAATGNISVTTVGGTDTGSDSFIITPTPHPGLQLGTKLVGTGATNGSSGANQGSSVAISADGNTAIVGGYFDNNGLGAAWIYTNSGGIWTQQGAKLLGTGASGLVLQGSSVAISADGNTAIVGGPYDNNKTGAVWVYTRSDTVWTQQGSKLVGTGAINDINGYGAMQGSSVSLSADGNTVFVGGPNDNNGDGAVWIFTRSGRTWTQQGPKLVGSGTTGDSRQGASISLSADGNTAIVGGSGDEANTGAAWVFTSSGGTWTQQGSKLVGTGFIDNYLFENLQGSSVSISADGNTAIVGAIYDNIDTGAVWIYTHSGGIWTQQGLKLVGTGVVNFAYQGSSVSLSADGSTAIVGGYEDDSARGAIWVYTRSGTTWSQRSRKLVGTGAINTPYGAGQGISVALSADGNTAIEGGFADNNDTGAAWVFIPAPCYPDSSIITQSICRGDTFSVGSNYYTSSGTYFDTITNIGGCDSIVTLYLSIRLPSYDTITQSICQGDTFTIGSRHYTTSNTYIDTLTNVGGCDSIVTLHLTVKPLSYDTIQQSICSGDSFSFGVRTYRTQGYYSEVYTGSNGCDSIVTLNLSVKSHIYVTIPQSICIGDSFIFHGFPYRTPGSFPETVTGSNGCDSTAILYLKVNPLPVVTWNQSDTFFCEDYNPPQTWLLTGASPAGGRFLGNNVTGDTLYTHQTLSYDTVTYSFTDSLGCTNSVTKHFTFQTCLGINQIGSNYDIHLYPNPNNGTFTLETSQMQNATYTISDMLGRVIQQEAITSDSQLIDIGAAPVGIYTLSISGLSGSVKFAVLR